VNDTKLNNVGSVTRVPYRGTKQREEYEFLLYLTYGNIIQTNIGRWSKWSFFRRSVGVRPYFSAVNNILTDTVFVFLHSKSE
jgi:hypothetical protein